MKIPLNTGTTIILFVSIIFNTACKHNEHDEPKYDLVIANVDLIDGTGDEIREGVNIRIKNGKIHSIDTLAIVQKEDVIDGTNKYVIPGLFDCHAHTSSFEEDYERFMHFGVTSILVPGGSTTSNEYYGEMRTLSAQDSLPAPRLFHTSQHFTLEGRHPVKTYPSSNWIEGETVFYLKDTLQIEALVEDVSQFPIVGIKITIEEGPAPPFVARMPQVFIDKVQKEAEKRGTEVFAHVSDNEELVMALKAGIGNIIHFTGVDIDFQRDELLVNSIYKSHISWVTTLMLDKSFVYPLYPEWGEQVENMQLFASEHVSKLKEKGRLERAEDYLKRSSEFYNLENPDFEGIISSQVYQIKEFYDNGVNMVLGTDTGNTFIFPGLSLHEEMQLLEMGGMPPLDIIKMGTHNAAKMLKVDDKLGTITEGKLADMILLDKNPLLAIENTLAISTVIKNGKIQKRISKE